MAFILRAHVPTDPAKLTADFQRYRDYLQSIRSVFPISAFALATSDWYFDPTDHRCPHDGWLEEVVLSEPSSCTRHENRTASLRIRLLAAYHDGFIEFHYPQVFNYSMSAPDTAGGHGDWLYDEFRLGNQNHVVHEIEWNSGRWLIEASDVMFRWIPK